MMSEAVDLPVPPRESGKIRRLPEDVVNRIAAGEVVCRPSAALKELIENSLDAGAGSVTITVRDGGLKLLQVSDDGKGIPQDDLPLLCERFATSKISSYDDLENVATFGFRGEALASMSHVARLSVLTKTRESSVAHRASYLDSAMRDTPVATAGVDGTTITIEDMFYNLPTRRRALKSSSDEYRLILEVVTRYAIHYPEIAFVCRRHQVGSSSRIKAAADVRTEANSSAIDNIRSAFGSGLVHETISFEVKVETADATVSAVVSTANFSMKKGVCILFINGRLVECQPFKRAIWAAYSSFLPKNGHPFVYIALKMKQSDIDVNVHPTKKEVRFLHESSIIDAVVEELNGRLRGTETSRTFLAQSILMTGESQSQNGAPRDVQPRLFEGSDNFQSEFHGESGNSESQGVELPESESHARGDVPPRENVISLSEPAVVPDLPGRDSGGENSLGYESLAAEDMEESNTRQKKKSKQTFFEPLSSTGLTQSRPVSSQKAIYAKDKVRTGAGAPVGLYDVFLTQNRELSSAVAVQAKRRRRPSSMPLLTSVENLLNEARRSTHRGIAQILKEHLFVGVASKKYALLQNGTKLLLADVDKLLVQLMYQQVLTKFADLEEFRLDPPAPVGRLLDCYLTNKSDSLSDERIDTESCVTVLSEKASMLSEYFAITFTMKDSGDLVLEKLPLVFSGVMPDLRFLGKFLYHVVVDTDWSAEEECFRDVSLRLAEWYGTHWEPLPGEGDCERNTAGTAETDAQQNPERHAEDPVKSVESDRREWVLRHVFFAAMRSDYYPPRRFFTEEVVREITSTSRLYKVFERC